MVIEMLSSEITQKIKNIYLENVIRTLRAGKPKDIIVEGYSMIPTIQFGSRVRIHPCKINEVEINQIIAYKLAVNPWITIHRVINRNETDQGIVLQTKGDHMKHIDRYVITSENFLGTVELFE